MRLFSVHIKDFGSTSSELLWSSYCLVENLSVGCSAFSSCSALAENTLNILTNCGNTHLRARKIFSFLYLWVRGLYTRKKKKNFCQSLNSFYAVSLFSLCCSYWCEVGGASFYILPCTNQYSSNTSILSWLRILVSLGLNKLNYLRTTKDICFQVLLMTQKEF